MFAMFAKKSSLILVKGAILNLTLLLFTLSKVTG